jgi:hypothetical protein
MTIEPQNFVVRFPAISCQGYDGSSFWLVPSNLKNGPGITDSGHFCTLLVISIPVRFLNTGQFSWSFFCSWLDL